MKYGLVGAALLSVAAHHVGLSAQQTDERPLSRSLTVEQTAIYDIVPKPATVTDDDGLDVLAWVDRSDYTYASGEDVQLFVRTNKDAYVTVLNVDPAGETTVLFPNRYQSDNFVAGGRTLHVPDAAAEFRIVVGGNVGTELLKVVASTQPIPLFEARQLAEAGPFQVARAQPARLARSLAVVMTGTTGTPSGLTTAAGPANNVGTSGSASTRPASSVLVRNDNQWALCHQAITTMPTLSAAARRTRSLTVQRTEHSVESVTCEEAR